MNPPSITDLKYALLSWGLQRSVLGEDAIRESMLRAGDAELIPFADEHAEFFRTRKIVKVSTNRVNGVDVLSLATRLPIARVKREKLLAVFAAQYAALSYRLEVVVNKAFKIDQKVQGTFKPVYYHKGRISCGSSVGLGNQRNAGSLMALAHNDNNKLVGISCNHVTGGCNTASVGTPIVSPGIQDVSPDHHEISVIGLHDSTGPMSQGLPQVFDTASNTDIAFFEIINPDLLSSLQGEGKQAYDTPGQFARIKLNLQVKKWGRSTDCTLGEISKIIKEPESIEYNVISYFGPASSQTFKGTVYFNELYEVSSLEFGPFSAGGDSGALVVTAKEGQEKVVGILIGGNANISYVLPIKSILKAQKLSLLTKFNI